MATVLQKIDLNNLDKSTWESFRFEVITNRVVEGVDPNTTTLEKYVGLEHIDAENIHIKRFGSPDDVSGGKLKCFHGDVIFGKRRAYQRKAAIVNFEGICSAHAFVFRANPEVIDPKLFPFFLHSDQFMHRAVDISVGGLSPTINWGDLKGQEFLLPPKAEQARLAELLWAMDDVIEKEKGVVERLEKAYSIWVDNFFTKENNKWSKTKISEIADINENSLKNSHTPEYEFKYLDIAGIIEPKTIGDLQKLKFKEAPSRARRIVKDNSIVLSLVRPYFKAFVHLSDAKNIIASTGTGVIDVKKEHNSKFIFHQFFSSRFMKFCDDRMTGTSYPAITPTDLSDFQVLLPKDIETENIISKQLDQFDLSIVAAKSKIISSQYVQKSIINQIF